MLTRIHSRVTDQLNVEQADCTRLLSSGVGTLTGAPANVLPRMSDTLIGVNAVCKLGNIMLIDDKKILCVSSNESTRAALKAFYDFIQRNKNLVKFTAFEDNGCYKVLRSQIQPLNNNKRMASSFLGMKLYNSPTCTTSYASGTMRWVTQTSVPCYS